MIDAMLRRKALDIPQLLYLQEKIKVDINNTDFLNKLIETGNNKLAQYVFSKLEINIKLFTTLIENKRNTLLKHVYSKKRYSNEFIVALSLIYRQCKNNYTSKEIIKGEREKFNRMVEEDRKNFLKIDELYQTADKTDNNEAFLILFENDGNGEDVLLKRIFQYDLLGRAITLNNKKWVKNILTRITFNNKFFRCEEILREAIQLNKKGVPNNEIIIDLFTSFIYNSSFPNRNYLVDMLGNNGITESKINPCHLNTLINLCLQLDHTDLAKKIMGYEKDKRGKSSALDLNVKDHNGQYPLFAVIKYSKYPVDNKKYEEMFQCLLDHGASPNIKTDNGVSLLMYSIQKRNEPIVDLILSRFVVEDMDMDKAISLALNYNNFNMVTCLIRYAKNHDISIPIHKKMKNGRYLLMEAITQKNFELVASLIEYATNYNIDLNISNDIHYTPLIYAYNSNEMEIFKLLVQYININERDFTGNNLLFYAIEKNDLKMVDYLIKTDIDTNNINNIEESIFDHALSTRNVRVLRVLLKNDCIHLNQQDSNGNTPLHKMIKKKDVRDPLFIKIMIENGSDVNVSNEQKDTPLLCAIEEGEYEIVKLLLENGATDTKDTYENTSLDYALKLKYPNGNGIREILLNYGFHQYNLDAVTETVIENLMINNDMTTLQFLFNDNLNINWYFYGENLIYYAIKLGNSQLVEYLLYHGADIDYEKAKIKNINYKRDVVIDKLLTDYENKYNQKKKI
ncbi:hypothetical protein PIROE2DRAFT_64803 [Piromyces sp. E2]|nr:hypothetical protein PIROE2DRAFT_64803 [Piromyces sp. E2]|eukprot:OUM57792.1 hypothetical protein PIROE2DRAFT_64803 [Piromyces sp. E2]